MNKTVTVRFRLERAADQTAWERLMKAHLRENVSLGRAIIVLLNTAACDEITSEQQTETTKQFAESVMAELEKTLPSFIAGCIAGNGAALPLIGNVPPAPASQASADSCSNETYEGETPDFSNSTVNWSFAGG